MKEFNEETVEKLVHDLKIKKEKQPKKFEPYIQQIRFPHYKMLQENAFIDFDFPFTVLIGENGCNKTSVLQALYGVPQNNSVGEYWFETSVDKIDDKKSDEKNCFIYTYLQQKLNKKVEVLKTRVNKKNQLDYWETSRPLKKYGMKKIDPKDLKKAENKAKTRWDGINKTVNYSDCKSYTYSYDLFFYHDNFSQSAKIKTKQDFIRKRSKYLAEVIKNKYKSYKKFSKERVFSNISMDKKACEAVSKIMGQDYSEIRIITHSLYSRETAFKPAKTIWMKKNNKEYSEAFAGTGESRIVLLVNDVINAKDKSLILIDEPEVSLHPRAIENFKKFLLYESLKKDLQIVITSHSPQMIKGLPGNAIKYMKYNNDTGEVSISNNTDYGEAFFELQDEIDKPIKIFVEDKLAKALVNKAIEYSPQHDYFSKSMNVITLPIGSKSMITDFVKASASTDKWNEFYIFDGDQKKVIDEDGFDFENHIFDEKILSGKKDTPKYLGKLINKLVGFNLNFNISGNKSNSNGNMYIEHRKIKAKFLRYWMSNVKFLPCLTPELGIIEAAGKKADKDDENGKQFFVNYSQNLLGDCTSDDIFFVQRMLLNDIKKDNNLLKEVEEIIKNINKTVEKNSKNKN